MSTPREEVVPIVKINSVDCERFISKLSEIVREVRRSEKVREEDVSLTVELVDIFTELVSKTTSDVIVPPRIAEHIVLTDALLLIYHAEESVLGPVLNELVRSIENNNKDELVKLLNEYIYFDRITYNAIIQVLKKRLTHIYVNLPPSLRPSLSSAFLGYEKVE